MCLIRVDWTPEASTWLHLIISKIFTIHHPFCCYVANSSCAFLLILVFIKSTIYCTFYFYCTFILNCILFLFLFFTSFIYHTYIYVYSLVFFIPYNCTVHGADLTYISQLVVFCIIVYVTNTNLESLDVYENVTVFYYRCFGQKRKNQILTDEDWNFSKPPQRISLERNERNVQMRNWQRPMPAVEPRLLAARAPPLFPGR